MAASDMIYYHDKMTMSDREALASKEFKKPFEQLDAHEKRHITGIYRHLELSGKTVAEYEPGSYHMQTHVTHTQEEREHMAMQEFGKQYAQLDEHQRRHVGAKLAAQTRAAHHAAEPAAAADEPHEKSVADTKAAEHQKLAQQEYGKPYEKLTEHQRRHIAGLMAAHTRAAHRAVST